MAAAQGSLAVFCFSTCSDSFEMSYSNDVPLNRFTVKMIMVEAGWGLNKGHLRQAPLSECVAIAKPSTADLFVLVSLVMSLYK